MRIDIVTPSRTQPEQTRYLSRMLASVAAQKLAFPIEFRVIVGLDRDTAQPDVARPDGVSDLLFARSEGASQAAALNAALALSDSDLIAFLEDDDSWAETFCARALAAMTAAKADMHSSNQMVYDDAGKFRGISDFPTPSSWLIRSEAVRRVGPLDTEYRYHLDHDWLGRAREHGVRRVHVVEYSAPRVQDLMRDFRPILMRIVDGGSSIFALKEALPLINRNEHRYSGMMQIKTDRATADRSMLERTRLRERYGKVPF